MSNLSINTENKNDDAQLQLQLSSGVDQCILRVSNKYRLIVMLSWKENRYLQTEL